MKCILCAPALTVLFLSLAMNAALAADITASSGSEVAPEDQAGQPTAASVLAAEVGEIAHFRMMSHAKKEKLIANIVRIAVVGGTAYKDQAGTINAAADLAAAAASAAPQFKDVIVHAVVLTPSVAGIDGATGQIQAAADYAAAQAGKAAQVAAIENPVRSRTAPKSIVPMGGEIAPQVAVTDIVAPSNNEAPPAPAEAVAPAGNTTAPATVENATPADTTENVVKPAQSTPWTLPKIDLGDNASLHFTADLNSRYDDNIFLSSNNIVSDETLSATPGAIFQFGQNSLANGSLSYQETFLEYVHEHILDQQLGTGAGQFGYSNDRLDLKASGDYGQFSENQEGFFVPGQNVVVRRNQSDAAGSAEVHFTEKTSAGAGVNYSDTHYRTPGLVNNYSLGWPVNFYYEVRPKVDLSAGFTQSEIKTPGTGPNSTQINTYYNIGARGDFTPKLTGTFSVGYTASKVTEASNTHLLSFSGNFSYDISPKTNLALTGGRNYTAGPLGEQVTNTSASLTATTSFSPQWQGNAALNYQNLIYPSVRTDNYVGGGVSAIYIFSTKVSLTLSYDVQYNASTLSTAKYLDNMVSLDLSLKY
jgi:hypothetical protein